MYVRGGPESRIVGPRLSEWGRGRVIFLVTHRLGSIRRADQILVLRDGCIVERGTHEELVGDSTGSYRRHVELEDAAGAAEPGR